MAEKPESDRVRATRRHLNETLLALLREEPISRVTVTALCRSARVNRSTYYVYFDNPFDQLDRLEQETIEELAGQLDRLDMGSDVSQGRLSAIVEATISYIGEHADVFRILWGEHGSMSFERRMLTTLASRALSPGSHDNPEAQEHLLQCIYSMSGTFALVYYWLTVDDELDREAIVQTIVRTNAASITGVA